MAIVDQIKSDMTKALKSGDKERLSVLRLIISAINYAEIDKQKKMDDNDVIDVLSKEAKKHKESIEAFEKGNRQDLVDKEKAELVVISGYMPQQMSREEIIAIVQNVINETGIKSPAEKGKVMGKVIPLTRGRAEGKEVNDIVTELLNKL
jgi:uncharacterized protein YqeY